MSAYHILNGDALLLQFPQDVEGERIVLRECLVDGPVSDTSLDKLFEIRAAFINDQYETQSNYYKITVPELEKLGKIPIGSAINLWFEDDLFCQVNLWFAVNLLKEHGTNLYLVRPETHTMFGFGGLDNDALKQAFSNRIPLTQYAKIARLWQLYCQDNREELLNLAIELNTEYPFIQHAVQAHLDRFPVDNYPGRPIETLKGIIRELNTDSFGPVFREFCKREPIYGFGDLQVKRLYDQLVHL